MKKIIPVVFSAILISFLLSACENSPTKPPTQSTVTDTTSHQFVWNKIPIGVKQTTVTDLAVISDTDIWVCGEIWTNESYTYDSLGNHILPYNVAHWNGKEWQLMQIQWCDIPSNSFGSADGVFAISTKDVWFCRSGKVAHWDGMQFTSWCIPSDAKTGYVTLVNGKKNDIYLYGTNGSITHFDGINFKKIVTGVSTEIYDAYSVGDTTICVASNYDTNVETTLLILVDGIVHPWKPPTLNYGMHSIWFDSNKNYFVAGNGVQRWEKDTDKWNFVRSYEYPYKMAIRGTAPNDIFTAGHFGKIEHFNGSTWKILVEAEPLQTYWFSRMVYLKDNVYILGYYPGQPVAIFHGKRRK